MTARHEIRRPDAGQPLAVWVVGADASTKQALLARLGGFRGQPGLVLADAEAGAHVALLDLGAAAPALRPVRLVGASEGPQAMGPQAMGAQAPDPLARLAELSVPAVVLVADAAQGKRASTRGARGVLRRGADVTRIEAALSAVAAGLTVVDLALHPDLRDDGASVTLTPREREVLELVAAGASNRRVAKKLGISEHTAKFHLNSILVKLSVNTRTEAVVVAARRGLITL